MDQRDAAGSRTLQRLRLAGLVAPVIFVGLCMSVRPILVRVLGHEAAHTTVDALLFGSAILFGWTMYRLLDRAHTVVVESGCRNAALIERERIARELHDSLAQVLGVTHLKLHALAGRPSVAADEKAHRDALELADLCHDAYADVREAIMGLRDATRPDRTLPEHLEEYVAAFARTSGIPTQLVLDEAVRLTPDAEVQLMRVVQEALTNVRKHSGARSATVHVSGGEQIRVVVADDGAGFDPGHTRPDGFGLTSMRDRAESVAGRLTIDSQPGRGTRVVVSFPRDDGLRSLLPEEMIA